MTVHDQEALIHSWDWDTLIILDACRYDIFRQVIPEFLCGALKKAHSPCSNTVDWTKRMWPGRYDLTYYSANPLINSKGPGLGFNGPGHFLRVVDVWNFGWSKPLSTVPAAAVTESILQKNIPGRKILHYMQPHGPWIGKTKLLIPDMGWMDGEILKRLNVGPKKLREAYIDNLRCALTSVKKVLEVLEGKIVLTSDHGELLGEYGLYCHAGEHIAAMDVPELRHVPWFVTYQGVRIEE